MSGPFINEHGDVVSSVLSVGPREDARHQFFNEMRILRGQIQKIYATDTMNNDPGNASGTYTVYDVLVWRPDGSTEVVKRCRAIQPLFGGSFNNFLEVLPADPGPNATNQDFGSSTRPGTNVIVGFIGGQKLYGPVILGALPSPNPVAIARRPSQEEGVYMEGEFQGLDFKIDNDGALTLTFNGPRDDNGDLINENGPTALAIDAQGNVTVSTNNKQTITIDRVNGVVDIVNGTTEIKMEQNGSKITTTSDFLTANVNKDAQMTVGGKTTVNSTSDVAVSSDSAIKLQRGANGPASQPFVLGNVFVQFMTEMMQILLNHTHEGNLGYQTYMMDIPFASQLQQLMQTPIGDNSILSDLIKGDK